METRSSITPLEKTVIDNIRRIRREKGISQEKLAIFCDTSASYIGLLETYKNIPKLSTIERIAEALNVKPIVLFTESEPVAQENEPVSPKLSEHLKKEILDSLSKNLDEIFKVLDTPTTH